MAEVKITLRTDDGKRIEISDENQHATLADNPAETAATLLNTAVQAVRAALDLGEDT